jgi:8-oxo-dGTP diphosphatase
MMEGRPLLVTAALIMEKDKLLIAQRLPDSRFEPNKWEFPGGKVDFGEHPEGSLKRELEEELGVIIKVGPLYTLASHVYDQNGLKRHVVILFYRCELVSGEPSIIDCQDIKWVTRQELESFSYVEGDLDIVEKLMHDDDIWTRT